MLWSFNQKPCGSNNQDRRKEASWPLFRTTNRFGVFYFNRKSVNGLSILMIYSLLLKLIILDDCIKVEVDS
jgi:hypothetical protein